MENDLPLEIAGRKITNRFFLGTGKFGSKQEMMKCIKDPGIEVVTVAMRRVDADSESENLLDFIPENVILMVNTSGARNAEEAVRIARLARDASGTDWIKIEVINDSKYLLPDNSETIRAVRILAAEGFTVFPYMSPDLYAAREMEASGAAAIMPLGSLIGSGEGLKAKKFIEILIREISLPVIVDAGIGRPSHAAEAMEMGAAAVLANTAVALAGDPASATMAFSLAVKAGRLAWLGRIGEPGGDASPSSPLTGFLTGDQIDL